MKAILKVGFYAVIAVVLFTAANDRIKLNNAIKVINSHADYIVHLDKQLEVVNSNFTKLHEAYETNAKLSLLNAEESNTMRGEIMFNYQVLTSIQKELEFVLEDYRPL